MRTELPIIPSFLNGVEENKQSEDCDQVQLINATQCHMKGFKRNRMKNCLHFIHSDCWWRLRASDSIILYFCLLSLREQLQILASYLHRFSSAISRRRRLMISGLNINKTAKSNCSFDSPSFVDLCLTSEINLWRLNRDSAGLINCFVLLLDFSSPFFQFRCSVHFF